MVNELSSKVARMNESDIVSQMLSGMKEILKSGNRTNLFHIEGENEGRARRLFSRDSVRFQYDSGNYRLRFVRNNDSRYMMTLTLLEPKIGVSDITKRMSYFMRDTPRIKVSEPGHDGMNLVVPFNFPERLSEEKSSHIFLEMMDYLKGYKPAKKSRDSIFPQNGASSF